ncbi:LolA family protein [Arenicella xantha]|uniref:LolA family protein n=1 Tax=Arenicella xantha TaxID=644221 RepID=UPI001472F680|nr:outer-membrane lipoprotein carrier protein LolA [Arenicella xantha]
MLLPIGLPVQANSIETSQDVPLPLSNQTCSFAGHFSQQRLLSGIPTPLESAGYFYFHCEHGVVWSTAAPIAEALVLQKGGAGYIVKDNTFQKLSSRQHKFLGDLLNSLMAGEQDELSKRFTIALLPDASVYRLTPKQRSLQRGISHIDLKLNVELATVQLTIVDRNQQHTIIESTQDTQFNNDQEPVEACASVESLRLAICQLLDK